MGCNFSTISLLKVADESELVGLKSFTNWASSTVPEIATTMATLVQNLIDNDPWMSIATLNEQISGLSS